ncbi:MAG: hypothetical protein HUU35_19490, partial [Armatimonadetes bacterium]|nr:hypothetical protein [Armatimonadota bacterium]
MEVPAAIGWLAARSIEVRQYREPAPADAVYDRLALQLGSHFDDLRPLHDQIRRRQGNGGSFSLDLRQASQVQNTSICNFCTELHRQAFLTEYHYDRRARRLTGRLQRVPRVINFITGGWFERYVLLITTRLLRGAGRKVDALVNPQIVYPNGDAFELDLVLMVDGEPLWIECKTGDYQQYVHRYAEAQGQLGLRPQRGVLVVLGLADEITTSLSYTCALTVTN